MSASIHDFPRGQPLHADRLAVHISNADPMSALHGEPISPRPRMPWLAISVCMVGLVMVIYCYVRWFFPWLAP